MTEHFESVKSMIANLRSEDPEARLNSMRGIHLISSTLGPERTREELLPYLTDYLDENDEVLRVFANALGTMLHEVGGLAHAPSVLTPLELLVSLDEITVRDEAVTSLRTVGEHLFREKGDLAASAQRDFVHLVLRLGKSTPQCRASAAALVATPYPHLPPPARAPLLQLFLALCADEEITVRRAACVAVGQHMAPVVGAAAAECAAAVAAFARDGSDGVRLQAVAAAAAMMRNAPDAHPALLAAVKALAADGSWRVRYMAADRLGEIAHVAARAEGRAVVPLFRALAQDAEAEIRAAAVFSMASVLAACGDASARREILTCGCKLVADLSAHVRMCLASAVLQSVPHVPREQWGSAVVPTCTQLLQDAEADVRLALVSGFGAMGNTAEARELAPRLVPVVVALAEDPKWRVREVVIARVPQLITSLGKDVDEVVDVCVRHLSDRVATIRAAAVESCRRLAVESGAAWARQTLFPRLSSLVTAGNYLHRVTLANFYASLAGVASVDRAAATQLVLPMLRVLAQDAVSNVRLCCARAIVALRRSGQLTEADTHPMLSKLRKDTDNDVSWAASQG